MKSRMERIYEKEDTVVDSNKNTRSSRNAGMYKRIYEDEIYTNIEGTIVTPKSNEIDISKIKDLFKRREEEELEKTRLVKRNVDKIPELPQFEEDEKNYDIMDVLKQAKEENNDSRENKYRSLDEEYLEDLKNPKKRIEKIPMEEDIKEIKSLLNTLTSSMELKKLKDTELGLDILSDLKDTKTIDNEDPLIKAIINETKNLEAKKEEEMDKTFNTTSVNIRTKDYEDIKAKKKKSPGLKILIAILIISVLLLIGFIGYKMFM